MTHALSINGRPIGPEHPPYIIAEISANHNGDLSRALAILKAAKEAGADAVKLQTYTADTMTIDCDNEDFIIRGGLWDSRKLYDLYLEAHTPWDWHPTLFEEAARIGITIFSSPFDATAVDFLEGLGAPAYKIASFELIDIPLIEKCAGTGKLLVMSRGMATLAEIEEAVETARACGCEEILLLHCNSGYPTRPCDSNLSTIKDLSERFDLPVGFSDHTVGSTIPAAACALGACAIEKHVTLSDVDEGPDSAFSTAVDGLSDLIKACRDAYEAIGTPSYQPTPSEIENRKLRRSIYAVADIPAGAILTPENVRCIRPAKGLLPREYGAVLGTSAARDIVLGEPIAWDAVAKSKK